MTNTRPTAVDGWVDVAAPSCSLPTAEKPLRLAEFDALFTTETESVERVTPTTALFVLRSEPTVAGRVAELSSLEAQCCSFFEFTLTVSAERLEMQIRVPHAHTDVLDALVAHANDAMERRSA